MNWLLFDSVLKSFNGHLTPEQKLFLKMACDFYDECENRGLRVTGNRVIRKGKKISMVVQIESDQETGFDIPVN